MLHRGATGGVLIAHLTGGHLLAQSSATTKVGTGAKPAKPTAKIRADPHGIIALLGRPGTLLLLIR
jgi:hypothetical protein